MPAVVANPRQAEFARRFVETGEKVESARLAGYPFPEVKCSRLLKSEAVLNEIEALQAPLRDEAGERRKKIMAVLEHDATMPDDVLAAKVAAGVPIRGADRNKARELLLRVDGALRDNLAVTVTHQPTELEVETQRESLALLREMREALRVAVAMRATAPALIEAPALEAEFVETETTP